MSTFMSTVDTQIGPFTAVVDDNGAVLAAGWTAEVADLVPLIHRGLREEPLARKDLGAVTRAVQAYHAGELDAPDAIEVRQVSDGAFLNHAWKVLREVGPRHRVTYTELAARSGHPTAVRAAAQACARNAAALFVPCHRVLRTDGTLGGFRWGLQVKRFLLTHEGFPLA
jgi:methylated-DNA-[protein]-cysteine S-methyltransferase